MKEVANFNLILGSGSPRRKQLLAECGFQFQIRTKEIDETPPQDLIREKIAMKLAEMKSEELILTLNRNELLITADTIVCLKDLVLNKPQDKTHAFEMLKLLSDNKHQVYTGVCIRNLQRSVTFFVETDVIFNNLSNSLIEEYIEEYKPYDKAGSYGAQDCLPLNTNPCSEEEIEFINKIGKPLLFEKTLAVQNGKTIPLIKQIEGSYFNVMGLPIVELSQHLLSFRSDNENI